MRKTLLLATGLLAILFCFAQSTLVPFGSVWKYLDNGSNQGAAWQATGFSDGAWASGPAKLGYGIGNEATIVSFGPNANTKYITTYFRKTVSIANASLFSSYTLKVLRDDGAVVYINGVEVLRSNMPNGTIAYTTKAPASSNTTQTISLPAGALTTGNNVIAVEVHQSSITSSDIIFDLELTGTSSGADVTPPTVTGIRRQTPLAQATTLATVIYAVSFSEAVTGVNAADFALTATGTAAGTISAVNGSGAAYTVTVSNITGTGNLRLDLKASGTGIVDAANNAIAAGYTAGETYAVSPAASAGPSVSSITRHSPSEQNTSLSTVTFAITFSEAVNGVDVSDFVLTKTGSADGTISMLRGTCANYTVTVTGVSGTGTLRLDLKANGTNILNATGVAISGGYTAGQTYSIGQ